MRRPGAAELARSLPEPVARLLAAVLAAADARGDAVYLVGGPVRDLLLGVPPRDVDLLVLGKGEAAAELARAAAPEGARVVAHERFGTASLRAGPGALDLALPRRESYARPAALPSVEPGSLEEDLARRDFSVNALALPLSRAARARHAGILEVEDGLRDLLARRLRVLHRASFRDDPTRALRAARLAARLGFAITRGTRAALRDALRSGAFGAVSGDRLRREVVRIFEDAALGLDPARALRLLSDWQVLGALEPELGLPRESLAPLRRLGRAVAAPPWHGPRWAPWQSGLAIWLAPLAAGLRRRVLRRLAITGEAAERIGALARTRDARLAALERSRGRGALDALLAPLVEEELQALYAWAPPTGRRRILRYATLDRARRAPVSGDDLLALGLAGPSLGRVLARVRAAFLDGALRSRDEALALAQELARREQRRGRG